MKGLLVTGWALLIAVASLWPKPENQRLLFDIPHLDKLIHLGIYGVLSVGLMWWLYGRGLSARWIAIGAGLYGALIECGQYAMGQGRSFEGWDIIANITGALLGVVLYTTYQSNRYGHISRR